MRGDADSHRASAAALVPIAVVAAAVLVLALLISGGRTGTIVVQRFVEPVSRTNGPQVRIAFTTITETSADGATTRFLLEDSLAKDYGSVIAGNTMERYIPVDRTVYVMSADSYERAYAAYLARRFRGKHVRAAPLFSYTGSWLAPGRESFFKAQLGLHNYRLAGRTTIDGRSALKLIPMHNSIAFATHTRAQMILQPAYVSPGSYDPIEEVSNGSERYVWTEYRVLPATAANQRLLSLTAEHPRAHISYSATAYIRAALGRIH
jgi:hypothetical protein